MKILSRENSACTFEFGNDELSLFLHVLQLYPCTPQSFQKISKFEDDEKVKESQDLLDQALAERKAENKMLIDEFIDDKKQCSKPGEPQKITFTEPEIDWLLQVLNDIRIGLWLKLGSPDQEQGLQSLKPDNIRDYSLMQLSGEFQGLLLYALNSDP